MHDASASVREWFRERVLLALVPVKTGKKTTRLMGDNRTSSSILPPAKKKGRGYEGPLPPARGRQGAR